jgi:hypothetical protein
MFAGEQMVMAFSRRLWKFEISSRVIGTGSARRKHAASDALAIAT